MSARAALALSLLLAAAPAPAAGVDPLMAAIEARDLAALEAAVEAGADLDTPRPPAPYAVDDSPLNRCVELQWDPCVDRLLDAGARIGEVLLVSEHWAGRVEAAVAAGDAAALERIVGAGLDLGDHRLDWGALHREAVAARDADVLRVLLDGARGVYATERAAAFLLVADAAWEEGIDRHLAAGDDLSESSEAGDALLAALDAHDGERVDALLRAGVDPETGGPFSTTRPILRAAAAGDRWQVDRLFDLGVETGRVDYAGSAVSVALEAGHVELARHLIERGADIEADSDDFSRPIEIAARTHDATTWKLLVARGASPDQAPAELCAGDPEWMSLAQARFCTEVGELDVDAVPLDAMLEDAIGDGDVDDVRALLDAGAAAGRGAGTWPLRTALRRGRGGIVDVLLAAGARWDAPAERGNGLLRAAVDSGDAALVERALANLSEAAVEADAVSAFVDPVRRGDLALVDRLIGAGLPLSPRLLTLALDAERPGVLDALIERGLDPAALGDGDSPHDAIGTRIDAEVRLAHAERLEALGFDPAAADPARHLRDDPGSVPWALVRWYLERGARLAADCCTALAAALVDVDDGERLALLIGAGADPDATTSDGTLLTRAVEEGRGAAVAALLDAGADPSRARIGDGATPLHLAVRAGHPGLAARLLAAGAAPDARESGREGATALHLAAAANDAALVRTLLEGGADVAVVDRAGRTAAERLPADADPELRSALAAADTGPRVRLHASRDADAPRRAVSPDGRLSLRSSAAGVELWDERSQRALRTVDASGQTFLKDALVVDFLDDERIVLAFSGEPAVEIRDVYSGTVLATLDDVPSWDAGGTRPLRGAAYDRERRRLAFSTGAGTVLVDADTLERLRDWDVDGLESLRFEADGTRLTGLDGRTLHTLPLDGGAPRVFDRFGADTVSALDRLAVTDDGRVVSADAAADGAPPQLRLWELDAGRLLRSVAVPDAVTALAVAPDGRRLATLDEAGRVRLLSLDALEARWSREIGGGSGTGAVAFAGDTVLVAPGGADLVALDAADGTERARVPLHDLDGLGTTLHVLDDARVVVGAIDRTVLVDWRSGEIRARVDHAARVRGRARLGDSIVAIEHPGTLVRLAAADLAETGRDDLDLPTGGLFDCFEPEWQPIHAAPAPDGGLVLGCSTRGPLRWTEAEGTVTAGDGAGIDALAASAGGRRLVAGRGSGFSAVELRQPSVAGARPVAVDTDPRPRIVAVAVDGTRALTGSFDREVLELWDLERGVRDGVLALDEGTLQPDGVALDAAGGRALTWSNGLAVVWDLATRTPRHVVDADDQVLHTALSPDGRRLATVLRDAEAVHVHALPSGEALGVLEDFAEAPRHVAFDGDRLLVAERHVSVFEAGDLEPAGVLELERGWARRVEVLVPGERWVVQRAAGIDADGYDRPTTEVHRALGADGAAAPRVLADQALLAVDAGTGRFLTASADAVLRHGPDGTEVIEARRPQPRPLVDVPAAGLDGDRLVLGDRHALRVHEAAGTRTLGTPPAPAPASDTHSRILAYGPDRRRALYGHGGRIVVHDVAGGARLACVVAPPDAVVEARMDGDAVILTLDGAGRRRLPLDADAGCTPAADLAATADDAGVLVHTREAPPRPSPDTPNWEGRLSADERLLALHDFRALRLLDLETGRVGATRAFDFGIAATAPAADGRSVAVAEFDGTVTVLDAESLAATATVRLRFPAIERLELEAGRLTAVTTRPLEVEQVCEGICTTEIRQVRRATEVFAVPGGERLGSEITAGPPRTIAQATVVDADGGETTLPMLDARGREPPEHDALEAPARRSDDGERLAHGDDVVRVWDDGGRTPLALASEWADERWEAGVTSVHFLRDGRFLLAVRGTGDVELFDVDAGRRVAHLRLLGDDAWLATDADGRFDTNRPGELREIAWVADDAPLTALPVEVFLNDYFEPRLVPRILEGERFAAATALADLNRVQPVVAIEDVRVRDARDGVLSVRVRVENRREAPRPGAEPVAGGVREVRLFRDGRQVALARPQRPIAPGRAATFTFDDVRLPTLGDGTHRLSAYAFNADGVKSLTAERIVERPGRTAPRERRAYVVSIGIDDYENPAWDLSYAGADARALTGQLADSLRGLDGYARVVPVTLASGGPEPTRARIRALLGRLAGEDVDAALLEGVDGAGDLEPVRPDDLVILSWAGHGYAEADGTFHLFPFDIGAGELRSVGDDLLSRTVTTTDLEDWLLPVDAGELVLVLDACNSAASVEGLGFRPGPMGSRGLGQLAYDKGMRILTASQAESVALESDALEHGLLAFALAREGLEQHRADRLPADRRIDTREWLTWASRRVPEIWRDLKEDPSRLSASRGTLVLLGGAKAVPDVQRPGLFDFADDADGWLISEVDAGAGEAGGD